VQKVLLSIAVAASSASVAAFTTPVVRRGKGTSTTQQLQPISPSRIDTFSPLKIVSSTTKLPMSIASPTNACASVISLALRGGASTGAVSMLTIENLFLALVVIAIGNGLPMAVAPHVGSTIYDLDTSRGTFDNWIVGCLGCFALNIGLATYYSTSGGYTPEVAVAVGNFPFLVYVLKDAMTREFGNAGMKKTLIITNSIIAAAMSWAILAGGVGNFLTPNLAAKILSILFIPQGLFAYLNPVGAAKFLVGKDVSKQSKSKALFVGFGALRSVSSSICAALAFGIPPTKAVGLGALIYASMLFEAIFSRKLHRSVGISKQASMYFNMVLCFFSARILLIA